MSLSFQHFQSHLCFCCVASDSWLLSQHSWYADGLARQVFCCGASPLLSESLGWLAFAKVQKKVSNGFVRSWWITAWPCECLLHCLTWTACLSCSPGSMDCLMTRVISDILRDGHYIMARLIFDQAGLFRGANSCLSRCLRPRQLWTICLSLIPTGPPRTCPGNLLQKNWTRNAILEFSNLRSLMFTSASAFLKVL